MNEYGYLDNSEVDRFIPIDRCVSEQSEIETNESKLYECAYRGRVRIYTLGVQYAKPRGITPSF